METKHQSLPLIVDRQIDRLNDGSGLAFNWGEVERRYRPAPRADKPGD